jgi:hypothetical protein
MAGRVFAPTHRPLEAIPRGCGEPRPSLQRIGPQPPRRPGGCAPGAPGAASVRAGRWGRPGALVPGALAGSVLHWGGDIPGSMALLADVRCGAGDVSVYVLLPLMQASGVLPWGGPPSQAVASFWYWLSPMVGDRGFSLLHAYQVARARWPRWPPQRRAILDASHPPFLAVCVEVLPTRGWRLARHGFGGSLCYTGHVPPLSYKSELVACGIPRRGWDCASPA